MLEQMLLLFTFILIGFVLGKTKRVNASHAGLLSALIMYVITPCTNFRTFANNFTVAYMKDNYLYLIVAVVIIVLLHFLGKPIANLLSKDGNDREVIRYSLAVPNFGYMGVAVVGGALGQEALLDFMVFTLPFNVYIFAVAYGKLTGLPASLKSLLNVPMISILIGAVIGMLGLSIPAPVAMLFDSGANCLAPVSMLLSGIVISEFDLRKLLADKNIYIVSALRLLAVPLLVGVPALLILPGDMGLIVFIFCALSCGLNTVVFPRLVDKDCHLGAGLALVSSVVACVTVPLLVHIVTKMFFP